VVAWGSGPAGGTLATGLRTACRRRIRRVQRSTAMQCLPIPGSLTLIEAAGIPETYFTVWTNLFQRVRLHAGETVLIHGGTSGIGTTAIQLARASVRGCSRPRDRRPSVKCAATGRGAGDRLSRRGFREAVSAATGGHGVNVILDMVAAVCRAQHCGACDRGAARADRVHGGSRVEADLRALMAKRLTITGRHCGRGPWRRRRDRAGARGDGVALLRDGTVRPIISETFPLDRVVDAHRALEGSAHIGKLILTM